MNRSASENHDAAMDDRAGTGQGTFPLGSIKIEHPDEFADIFVVCGRSSARAKSDLAHGA